MTPALHIGLAKQGVATALAARFDSSVRITNGVIRLALEPPIPYDKRLIWLTADPLPAPVRALLSIWRELCAAPGTPTGTRACTPGSAPHVKPAAMPAPAYSPAAGDRCHRPQPVVRARGRERAGPRRPAGGPSKQSSSRSENWPAVPAPAEPATASAVPVSRIDPAGPLPASPIISQSAPPSGRSTL